MKQVRKNSILLFAIAALTFSACENSETDLKNLSEIYVELNIAEQKYSPEIDSVNFYKNKVFEKYKTTPEKYMNKLNEIEYNDKLWREFFKLANNYLDTLKARGQIK